MQILRALALVAVVVLCGGFVPVGGCAKGCGKLAGSGGDDVVRTGARYGDDIAISSSRYSDDLGRYSGSRYGTYTPGGRGAVVVPPGGVHVGDDFAHLSSSQLDDAVTALPEIEGSVASMAKKPTPSGARLDGLDEAGFARDYGRSVDDLKLTPKQHEEVMDAFDVAQDVAEEVIGNLAEDDDDGVEARKKLQVVSKDLEERLAKTLTPKQHEQFEELLGAPEVVAYRLGKEKPVKRDAKKQRAKKPAKLAEP